MKPSELQRIANERRADAITMIARAKAGHAGGAMSCLDILSCLYYDVLRIKPDDPTWPLRDRLLLSKGHSVEGYLVILADLGFIEKAELREFSQAGSRLVGNPTNSVPGVEMCTGALGHGLSIGVGMALGAKRTQQNWSTYVVMGDGELAEGAVWEAAMAGAHYKLDNLFAIVDRNEQQITGATEDVMKLEDLAAKWRAFGWDVSETNGHDMSALTSYFHSQQPAKKPHCLIAHTIKGKGLPFAENNSDWRHHTFNDAEMLEVYKALGIKEVNW